MLAVPGERGFGELLVPFIGAAVLPCPQPPPAPASPGVRGHPAAKSQVQQLPNRALMGVYETFNKTHSKLGMALQEVQLPAQGLFLAEGGGQLLSRHPVLSPPWGERCWHQDWGPGTAASPGAAKSLGQEGEGRSLWGQGTSKEDAERHQACTGRVKKQRLEPVGVPACSPSPHHLPGRSLLASLQDRAIICNCSGRQTLCN